jgi:predicted O-linked N-acetylglucosamine transferase (SPINDLY family)
MQHHQAGRLQIAEQIYRQILGTKRKEAEVQHLLGLVAFQRGEHENAVAHISQAISANAKTAVFHHNLGEAYLVLGRIREAVACYCHALELKPDFPGLSQMEKALASGRRALELEPDSAHAHNNLGVAFHGSHQLHRAIACYQRALALKPDLAEISINLGLAYQQQGQLDEALRSFRQAVQTEPDSAETYLNLGNVFKEQTRLAEALGCYRQALSIRPDFRLAASNLLCALYFSAQHDAAAILAEHRRWNQQFAKPLAGCLPPPTNDRLPGRRLRIGYVSPDFRNHPIGRFLLPLLQSHDHTRFEIFCYSSLDRPDAVTDQCRAHADMWREVYRLSDQQLAELIRQDRIDILVDTTMHIANNRLLVFARKPAPIQVTYLSYPGTTGLDTMDYRLTDPYLDPPGADEARYSEQSIRLPETYWCYRPMAEAPPVNELPTLRTGQVTFGCLNNFCKVSAPTLATWSRLLRALPQSRLVLNARWGSHRERVLAYLAGEGIDESRVEFLDFMPPAEYFRTYHRLDICLDPFPYGGGTTTCDALWMGVPVVSLAGKTAVGRGGRSILSNIALSELVACDAEEYVRIAMSLAMDRPRLANLRATLRARMQASPLMDAPRFARHVEAAYRDMWSRWCRFQGISSGDTPAPVLPPPLPLFCPREHSPG